MTGVLFVACGVYHSIFTVLEQMLLIVIVSSAVVRTSDHHNQQHMTMTTDSRAIWRHNNHEATHVEQRRKRRFCFNLIWSHGGVHFSAAAVLLPPTTVLVIRLSAVICQKHVLRGNLRKKLEKAVTWRASEALANRCAPVKKTSQGATIANQRVNLDNVFHLIMVKRTDGTHTSVFTNVHIFFL